MNRFEELRNRIVKDGAPISQRKLAEMLKIKGPHISELESGKRTASLTELKAYHDFFMVSYEYLLGETNEYVCSDIFREKPMCETEAENTLRWIQSTISAEDDELKRATNLLLGTQPGLAMLFYIERWIEGNLSIESLEECKNILVHSNNNGLSFPDLRLLVDQQLNIQIKKE